MQFLTIGPNGELDLDPDMLKHLNVRPGQKLKAELMPDGRLLIAAKAKKPAARLKQTRPPRLPLTS